MMLDLGILALRLTLGLVLAAHGAQKLFGWFGGPRLSGTAHFLGSLGLRPPRVWAVVVGLAEFGGGLLTASGFLGPVGPALIVAVMIVAMALVHARHGFWNSAGGVEFPALIALTAIAVALTGSGRYAVDRVLALSLHEPAFVAAALFIALVGAALCVVTARRTTQPAGAAASA